MIPKKTAKQLVDRFSAASLREPPADVTVLIGVLASHARSEKHGQSMIDNWIGRSEFWPKPANIVQLAAELEDPDNLAKKAREICEYCHGDNFVSRDQPYGLSAAIPCDHTGNFPGNLGVKLAPATEAMYKLERAGVPRPQSRLGEEPDQPDERAREIAAGPAPVTPCYVGRHRPREGEPAMRGEFKVYPGTWGIFKGVPPCLTCGGDVNAPDHRRGCPLAPEPTKEELLDLSLAIEAGWRQDEEIRRAEGLR